MTGKVKVRELNLGECQILAFRKVKEIPQLIASSRHVSMDAVSVKAVNWENNQLSLLLNGVKGTIENYWIAVPQGYTLKDAQAEERNCPVVCKENVVCAPVEFEEEETTVTLTFSERKED